MYKLVELLYLKTSSKVEYKSVSKFVLNVKFVSFRVCLLKFVMIFWKLLREQSQGNVIFIHLYMFVIYQSTNKFMVWNSYFKCFIVLNLSSCSSIFSQGTLNCIHELSFILCFYNNF